MNRVRFAPSPTGFLHVGGARTYIFNWLFSRSTGGQIVLRIDDTDVERSTHESLQSILEGLEWLELSWDEQHFQSKRNHLHRQAVDALLAKGAAYRDFTPDNSDSSEADTGERKAWLCNPGMRELPQEESDRRAEAGERFVVRFRVPRERDDGVPFKDLVYKKQFRKFADIEDFALARSNGDPTYHLASTVDDGDLGITHVIRGQDHLTNTHKHILIFEALGYDIPQFGHLPLLLGPDGSKLSKRKHGPVVSVTTYRDKGFLPAAFVNYLSLLGWSPKDDRQVLSVDELVSLFKTDDVLKANAVVQFGEVSEQDWADSKALWLNAQHLRALPAEQLLPHFEPELKRAGWWKPEFDGEQREWLIGALDAFRERFTLTTDLSLRCKAYFEDSFEIDEKAIANLDKEGAREGLKELGKRLEAASEFTEESIEAVLRALAEEQGVKPGLLINGARAALTGQAVGPGAFKVFTLVGRQRVIARLAAV
jgi:glutamyl-tRNA synthetase